MDRVPMDPRLAELSRRYQREFTLIGWSLGGVFARELARGRDATILRPVCQPSDRGADSRDPSIGE